MSLFITLLNAKIEKARRCFSSPSAATPSISRRANIDYYTPYPYKSIGMPHESEML